MKRVIGILLLIALGIAGQARAGWQTKDSLGMPVIVYQGNQWNVHGVPDGKNGAIVVWQDRRDGVADKIFAQHLDGGGNFLWGDLGNQLSYTPGFQYYPEVIPDGGGGAFVVWEDNRGGVDYDIYAQHLSADGSLIWGSTAKAVCTQTGHQYNPVVAYDGSGGIIIVWQDKRSGGWDVYAQLITWDGKLQWGESGRAVCALEQDQVDPQVTSDGNGGVIVVWGDYRTSATYPDLYTQHIRSDGTNAWTANGIPVCMAANTQWRGQVVSDGANGAILTWLDRRSGASDQLYAQRIGADGVARWGQDGVRLCSAPGIQYNQRTISDGKGGAFVAWQDNRTGADYDIYVQHVAPDGSMLWGGAGHGFCVVPGQQYNPDLAYDGTSLVVTWQDKRDNVKFQTYAQSCGWDGYTNWNAGGVVLGRSSTDQTSPIAITDGATGAIAAWTDFGSGSGDVYAERIAGNGVVGGGSYRSLTQEQFAEKSVRLWNRTKGNLAAPTGGNISDSLFRKGGVLANGLILGIVRDDQPRDFAWQNFTRALYIQKALPQTGIARPYDMLNGRKLYGVMRNPTKLRYNNRLSGEALVLKLNIVASDAGFLPAGFGDLIYNDNDRPGFALNHRSVREISRYVDTALTNWAFLRGVSYPSLDSVLHRINSSCAAGLDTISSSPMRFTGARNIFSIPYLSPGPSNARQALSSDLFAIAPSAGENNVPGLFALMQNYPNPFNPGTQIEFQLKRPAIVTLAVYNVLGQRVASLYENTLLDAGMQSAWFDGSRLASGTYFYRLNTVDPASGTAAAPVLRKMNLIK